MSRDNFLLFPSIPWALRLGKLGSWAILWNSTSPPPPTGYGPGLWESYPGPAVPGHEKMSPFYCSEAARTEGGPFHGFRKNWFQGS